MSWLKLKLHIHQHRFVQVTTVTRAEIDETNPVYHTGFIVLGCVKCRELEMVPRENFDLCTPRWVQWFVKQMRAEGWKIGEE